MPHTFACDLLTLICQCGHIVLHCGCPGRHDTRLLQACSRCPATGTGARILMDEQEETDADA